MAVDLAGDMDEMKEIKKREREREKKKVKLRNLAYF
jgi:hypothetical protein